jgi:transcriptional regulator with XRE-family HTH domain
MSTTRPNFESGQDLVIDMCDRMKLARVKAGLQQHEMAEQLNVSASTISNWENGRVSVKSPFLVSWAQVTGYNVSSLIPPQGGDGDREPGGRSLPPAREPDHARAEDDSVDTGTGTGNELRAAIEDPENTVQDGEVYIAWAEGKPFGR